MKIFLIVLAVIVVIFAIILSLSAEVTVVFDNGWHTKVKVLFIEKDIQLSKVLSFLVAPEKAAQEVSAEHKEETENKNKKDKNKDKDNQNKDQNKGKNKNDKNKNNQNKNNQQNQNNQDKMSKDNAEQLLNAAIQQEKDTKRKMQKAMSQPRRKQYEKNW